MGDINFIILMFLKNLKIDLKLNELEKFINNKI